MSRLVSYLTVLPLVSSIYSKDFNLNNTLLIKYESVFHFILLTYLKDIKWRPIPTSILSPMDRLDRRERVRCGFCHGSTPLMKLTKWDL